MDLSPIRELLATAQIQVLLWYLLGCLAMLVIVAIQRHLSWVGLTDCFLPLEACISPSGTRKLVFKDEAFASVPFQILWLLCPKCLGFSAIGTYLQILGGNQGNSNCLYSGSLLASPDQQLKRFFMPGSGVLLDNLWLLEGGYYHFTWCNFIKTNLQSRLDSRVWGLSWDSRVAVEWDIKG